MPRKATDEAHLPGEDRQEVTAEEARHWVEIYDELSQAVRGLILDRSLKDTKRLRGMLISFEQRRAWWRSRL
jgi:hypothetical protein